MYKYTKVWRLRNREKRNDERKRYYRKHQLNKTRSRQPWTDSDIASLRCWIGTDTQLSVLLHRSVQAIQNKRFYLKKSSANL